MHIDGQIKSPEELMNQIIGYQNNGAIRLRDVGQVIEGLENMQLAAWSGKAPALILSVQRQPGPMLLPSLIRSNPSSRA